MLVWSLAAAAPKKLVSGHPTGCTTRQISLMPVDGGELPFFRNIQSLSKDLPGEVA
jgi:hypothetical protein